jgi:hypothetical protein
MGIVKLAISLKNSETLNEKWVQERMARSYGNPDSLANRCRARIDLARNSSLSTMGHNRPPCRLGFSPPLLRQERPFS